MQLIEKKLPSGATLKISPAPYADALEFTQVILRELRGVSLDGNVQNDAVNQIKNTLFTVYSSPVIMQAGWKCMSRAIYNNGKGDFKIVEDTFEPAECREDFFAAFFEVALVNVTPFLKSLFAQFSRIPELMKNDHA